MHKSPCLKRDPEACRRKLVDEFKEEHRPALQNQELETK